MPEKPSWYYQKLMRRDYEAIKKLWAQIPSFECIPGCLDCCGVVVFAEAEWYHLPDKRVVQTPEGGGLPGCPYHNKRAASCDIHSFRPFQCRMFGATVAIPCKRGCRPEAPLSEDVCRRLSEEYGKYLRLIEMADGSKRPFVHLIGRAFRDSELLGYRSGAAKAKEDAS